MRSRLLVGRLSESLRLGTDQYCLEDEGVVTGVCDEEDGEGLIEGCIKWILSLSFNDVTWVLGVTGRRFACALV